MSGPSFWQTMMGKVYYEGTLPRIARALERIAAALEAQNRATPTPNPHTHQGTHMNHNEIHGLAEAMLYSFDLQDPDCETAILTRPEARNCKHWDLKEIAALADDLSIPTDALDEEALERLADAYASLAKSYATATG